MKIHKKVTVEEEQVDLIICNKCGKEYSSENKNKNLSNLSELNEFEGLTINNTFGYESEYFGDETKIEFSVCEKCLFEFVKSFKFKPVTNEFDTESNRIGITYKEAVELINKIKKKKGFLNNCDE